MFRNQVTFTSQMSDMAKGSLLETNTILALKLKSLRPAIFRNWTTTISRTPDMLRVCTWDLTS